MKNQISKTELSSTTLSPRKNGAGFTPLEVRRRGRLPMPQGIGLLTGFSLIELMIAISIFVVIAGVAIVSLNPIGQFSKARNTQREFHLQALMAAIRQNIADSQTGGFTCTAGSIPTSTTRMAIGGGNYDIAGCLVPTYITTLPFDPSTSSAHYASNLDYDTGYTIVQATSTRAITLSAPAAELKKTSRLRGNDL